MAAPQTIREIEPVRVSAVYVAERLRAITEESIETMAASMAAIGLLTPITVRVVDMMVIDGREVCGVPILVTGATRLAAAKRLGWQTIDTLTAEISEVEARKHEIAENLHRSDLTVQERADHVAEWVRLAGADKGAQLAPPGGRQPHEKGIKEAVRELGVERTEAQRAVKIASISERAREAAVAAHLDNNQSALLKIASSQPAEQVERVREIAAERDARKARRAAVAVPLAATPLDEDDAREKWLAQGMSWWNRAPQDWRNAFFERVDIPVMDRSAAQPAGAAA